MKMLVSADNNWAIGRQGDLLLRIPEDMRYFKQLTIGKVIVMGRKTFDSLPGGRPLQGRSNVVLSATLDPGRDDIMVCNSLEKLLALLQGWDSDDVYIIGGAGLFALMLPYCDTALVTRIDHEFAADTVMTNLDLDPDWQLTEESGTRWHQDIPYRFTVYRRVPAAAPAAD